ncbi:MAG: hypothetical protein KC442_10575 [Thermomicrobiales bacterium]|nr:hypothetical protein [Thermomicrobiales bacterium]
MANEVYRIVTAEGHEHDWHGGLAALDGAHPGAVVTGQRVLNALGEGHYEPYRPEPAPRKSAAAAEPAAGAPAAAPASRRAKGG